MQYAVNDMDCSDILWNISSRVSSVILLNYSKADEVKLAVVQRWLTSHCQLKPAGRIFFFFTCVWPEFLASWTWSPPGFAAGLLYFWQYATASSPGLRLSETKKSKRAQEYLPAQWDIIMYLRQTRHCEGSRTWKVLDGELAGLGEGNVSTYPSWAGLRVHCPLAVRLGSGKTQIVRGIKRGGGDIIESELLCI